jgi:hypothetical protein
MAHPVAGASPPVPSPRPGTLRVATWNCRRALAGKAAAVAALQADVLVVPEAQLEATAGYDGTALFKGAEPSLGLAVLVAGRYRASVSLADPGLPWLLPVDVWDGQGLVFTVLALWTVKRPGDGRPSYALQAQQAFSGWVEAAARTGRDPWDRVVLAGDFNASFQGPSNSAHARTVAMLETAGMGSVHHLRSGQTHGEEVEQTLRWIGPGKVPHYYHCDYIWISQDLQLLLSAGAVGGQADWVDSGLSDHAPVWADMALSQPIPPLFTSVRTTRGEITG